MAVRFKFPTLLFAGLLLGSCAEEGEPQTPRDLSEETGSSTGSRDDDDGADSDDDAGASDDDAGDDDESNAEDDENVSEDDGDDDAGTAEDEDGGAAADEDGGAAEDEDEVAASCDELTYEDFGETFVDTYCIACHTGDQPVGGFPLDTLDDIEEHKAEIIEHAVELQDMPMPPQGSKAPTAGEREMLEAWLDCGPE